MSTKQITIQKNYLTPSSGSSSKPRQRKRSSRSGDAAPKKQRYGKLKNQILERVRSMHNEDGSQERNTENEQINQLEDSLQYINSLIEKHKQRKNKTLKRKRKAPKITKVGVPEPQKPSISLIQPTLKVEEQPKIQEVSKVSPSLQVPPVVPKTTHPEVERIVIKDAPSYGVLKGGEKPTYRQVFNKTLKRKSQNDEVTPTQQRGTLYEKFKQMRSNQARNKGGISKRYKKYKLKTFKKKYNLGKNVDSKKIGVLIKDNKTKKNIRENLKEINKKTLLEKKEELRKRNILKIGSTAPDKIIHSMYNNMILSGDIVNTSSDVLIHNYMNDNDM